LHKEGLGLAKELLIYLFCPGRMFEYVTERSISQNIEHSNFTSWTFEEWDVCHYLDIGFVLEGTSNIRRGTTERSIWPKTAGQYNTLNIWQNCPNIWCSTRLFTKQLILIFRRPTPINTLSRAPSTHFNSSWFSLPLVSVWEVFWRK
jgi:hypothetical protein